MCLILYCYNQVLTGCLKLIRRLRRRLLQFDFYLTLYGFFCCTCVASFLFYLLFPLFAFIVLFICPLFVLFKG